MEEIGRLSVAELRYWAAYYRVEPFGPVRQDWQTAMLLSFMWKRHYGRHRPPTEFLIFEPSERNDPIIAMRKLRQHMQGIVDGRIPTGRSRRTPKGHRNA